MPYCPAMSQTGKAATLSGRYPAMDRDWPLLTYLAFGALPGAVPCARLHARHVLREWRTSQLRESVELVVSELITNAVAAARTAELFLPVRFWMVSDGKRVLVLVWDANPNPPVRRDPDENTEAGRGLMLVEAVSTQWDWHPGADTMAGKVVWALIGPPISPDE